MVPSGVTLKSPVEFSLGSFPVTNLDLANTTNHIRRRPGGFEKTFRPQKNFKIK